MTKIKEKNSVALTRVLFYLMIPLCILFTYIFFNEAENANIKYYEAEGFIWNVYGPEIQGGYKRVEKYIYCYDCTFKDKDNIEKNGVLREINYERGWKHSIRESIPIYYSEDFEDGDYIYDYEPKAEPEFARLIAVLLWLVTLGIYCVYTIKRRRYVKKYGRW